MSGPAECQYWGLVGSISIPVLSGPGLAGRGPARHVVSSRYQVLIKPTIRINSFYSPEEEPNLNRLIKSYTAGARFPRPSSRAELSPCKVVSISLEEISSPSDRVTRPDTALSTEIPN